MNPKIDVSQITIQGERHYQSRVLGPVGLPLFIDRPRLTEARSRRRALRWLADHTATKARGEA